VGEGKKTSLGARNAVLGGEPGGEKKILFFQRENTVRGKKKKSTPTTVKKETGLKIEQETKAG